MDEQFNRAGRRDFERKKRAAEAERRRRNKRIVLSSGAALGIGASLVPTTSAAAAVGPTIVDRLGDSAADEAAGTTFREAIENANADAAADVITFSVSGVIQLEQGQLQVTNPVTINGATSSGGITVVGDAVEPDRVFYFGSGGGPFNAFLYDLTVTGGDAGTGAAGGGILVRGVDLTVDGVTVTQSSAGEGGGIAVLSDVDDAGVLTLLNSSVTGNTADNGGGIYVGAGNSASVGNSLIAGNDASEREVYVPYDPDTYSGGYSRFYGGFGGGVFGAAGSVVSITDDSTIEDNFATNRGGGIHFGFLNTERVLIAAGNGYGGLEVVDSTVASNDSERGGGISVVGSEGAVHLLRSHIIDNTAADGGGIALEGVDDALLVDSLVDGNVATGFEDRGGMGGGIHSKYSTLIVDGSTVSANQAIFVANEIEANEVGAKGVSNYLGAAGGGIAVDGGETTVRDSTVTGNEALFGGGVWSNHKYGGSTLIDRSTVSDNQAKYGGGGVYATVVDTALTLVNSTISGNEAVEGVGGGVFIDLKYDETERVGAVLAHTTIADNYAGYDGGGIFLSRKYEDGGVPAVVVMDHTIVGVNDAYDDPDSSGDGYDEISGEGEIISRFSLISNLAEVGPGIVLDDTPGGNIEGNPQLGPLQDNDGPTFTHHPLAGSRVVDAGQNTVPDDVPTDQRGFPRLTGPRVDIGAVEVRQQGGGGPAPDPFECTEDATMPAQDVPADNVHRLNIACLYEIGGTVGTGPTTYGPSEPTTRGQMASFIANIMRIVGFTLPDNPPDAFDDDNGHVHERAINQLAALGVIGGKAPRVYDPEGHVSREQMARFLVGAYEVVTGTNPTASGDHFTDDEESVFEDDINVGFELDLFVGTVPGSYDPTTIVRRDQMATFLINLVDKLADEGSPPLLR